MAVLHLSCAGKAQKHPERQQLVEDVGVATVFPEGTEGDSSPGPLFYSTISRNLFITSAHAPLINLRSAYFSETDGQSGERGVGGSDSKEDSH